MTTDTPVAFVLDHAGASVSDLERSIRFYVDAFGFAVEERFAIPAGPVRGAVLVNGQGSRLELFHRHDSEPGPPGHPVESTRRQGWFQVAFSVPDVPSAFARLLRAGATSVKEPFVAPDGRSMVAFVGDPDGNLLELIHRPAGP